MKQSFHIPPGRFAGEGYQQYDAADYRLRRNGFVTFWLWLAIIGSIISTVSNFVSVDPMSLRGYGPRLIEAGYGNAVRALEDGYKILQYTSIIGGICSVVGYFMILCWRKSGFWLLIIASVVIGSVNIYAIGRLSDASRELSVNYDVYYDSSMLLITMVAGAFISWIILWAILQIKKNGKSCWSQLG